MKEIKELTKKQVENIYYARMKKDFPPDELRPLQMIYKVMDEGLYVCYGLIDEGNILGYVFLARLRDTADYLVDYLAVKSDMRNQGIGALILEKLRDILNGANSIIVEVENPEYAQKEEEKALKTRRYDFYMRNGLVDTGVKATCFGVPFILLEMTGKKTITQDTMKELYKAHYKELLPKEMYEKNVFI